MPSASDAFTPARCFKRARTAGASPALTASMRLTGTAAETVTEIKIPNRKTCRARMLVSNLHGSRADSELVDIAIELVGKRYHQVCDRRFLCSLYVTIALHLAGSSADEECWEIQARVGVAFAHAATIKNQRMIQQGAVAVWRGLQSLQKLCEHRGVVRI